MIENLANNEIAIALGPKIYCGISRVSGDTVTVCALEQRRNGDVSIRETLPALARANPHFGRLVPPAVLDTLRTLPVYGTGNLFFGHREMVANGVLMVGDSAGMIAPLAGDGIGIAMEQARMLGRLFAEMRPRPAERESFTNAYRRESERIFAHRKRVALICQQIALSEILRPAVTPFLWLAPGLLKAAVGATRGNTGNPYSVELA
jgi:2-polyprenyl-6-methoxyphenol hydroxylase-like FAD-dependent oxidoreductase